MKNFSLSLVFFTVLSFATINALANDSALLKRGEYLVENVLACSGCHQSDYSGGITIKEHTFAANVANITQDKETGIGSWSDQEIMLAIREGLRPDGSVIGYPMPIPLYRSMSDNDLAATVAYLRTIKPVNKKVTPSSYPGGLPDSYGPPINTVKEVARADKVAYGEYLAKMAHCIQCHTPVDENFNRLYEKQIGAGGFEFTLEDGSILTSANITPAGNLPNYSDEGIKNIIQTGIRPDGSKLVRFMDFDAYKNITEEDMTALIAYLRSLKPAE